MKKFIFLITLLFSLTVFTTSYSQLPQTKAEHKEIVFPDPTDLSSSWWDYFEVDEDEFNVRKEKFISALDNLTKDLNEEQKQIVSPIINKITMGLNKISEYKKSKIETPQVSTEFKDSYSVADIVKLGNAKYELSKQLKALDLQLVLEKQSYKADEKKLSSNTEKYEDIENSFKKLVFGLDIINLQISLEIDHYQIELSKDYIDQKKKSLSFLDKEATFAIKHLVYFKEYLSQIENEKSQLKESLKNLQATLENINTELTLFDYKNNIETFKYNQLIQAFLQASAKEAIIKSKIINNDIQNYFLSLGLKKIKIKTSKLYSLIKTWNEKYDLLQEKSISFKKQADINFEKTIRSLSENQKNYFIVQKTEKASKEILIQIHDLEKNLFLTDFLIDEFTLEVKEKYTSFFDKIYGIWTSLVIFYKKNVPWLSEPLFKIGKKPITPGGILKFLAILFLTYIFAKILSRSIRKFGKKQKKLSSSAIYTLSRLTFYIVISIGIIIAIVFLGVDFTAFAFIAGALGVGIGFGLQSFFSNFIAGIILLVEKYVRVGDFIQLESGEYGTIIEINVRTTLMRTLDNLEILIPNNDLVLKKFTNWTLSEKIRRVRVPFSVAYGTDKDKVKKAVIEAAKTVPLTLKEKEPDVWLVNFADSALSFELVVWVNEYAVTTTVMATTARYLWAIETALKENNITIPFPQRDVHIFERK